MRLKTPKNGGKMKPLGMAMKKQIILVVPPKMPIKLT